LVWQDSRPASGSGWNIYGGRVLSTGATPDGDGFAISVASGNQTEPSIARGTSSTYPWLVAWNDTRADVYGDVYCARIDANPQVVESTGIALATTSGSTETRPSVAPAANDGWLIAWDTNSSSISARGVDGAGNPGASPYIISPSDSSARRYPSATQLDTEHYLVAWQVYGTPLSAWDAAGTVTDAGGAPLSTNETILSQGFSSQLSPSIAAGRDQYLIVWSDTLNSGDEGTLDVIGTRIGLETTRSSPWG
jgi:hypothetical protein